MILLSIIQLHKDTLCSTYTDKTTGLEEASHSSYMKKSCSSDLAGWNIFNVWCSCCSTTVLQWSTERHQPSTRSTKFYTELQDLLDEISGLPGRSIICGDFNCPSVAISSMWDQRLIDIVIMNDCWQHVSDPTHRYSGLLDLLNTSNLSSVITSLPTLTDHPVVSDKFVVQSMLNVSWSRPSTVKFCHRNFISLNISQFRRALLASSVCIIPMTTTN